jgi:hypothetical protein
VRRYCVMHLPAGFPSLASSMQRVRTRRSFKHTRQLPPIRALAGFHLGVLANEFPPAAVQVVGDGSPCASSTQGVTQHLRSAREGERGERPTTDFEMRGWAGRTPQPHY